MLFIFPKGLSSYGERKPDLRTVFIVSIVSHSLRTQGVVLAAQRHTSQYYFLRRRAFKANFSGLTVFLGASGYYWFTCKILTGDRRGLDELAQVRNNDIGAEPGRGCLLGPKTSLFCRKTTATLGRRKVLLPADPKALRSRSFLGARCRDCVSKLAIDTLQGLSPSCRRLCHASRGES